MEDSIHWIQQLMQWLVHVTDTLGYWGILIMTFIDATIVPFPIEATLIPAGYLVHQGKMDYLLVFLISVVGTTCGSYANYWLAKKFGRDLFTRYGKFFMMTDAKLAKLEKFFAEHGAMSVFAGRLFPGLRHYIALPAGLARMNLRTFFIYTGLGGIVLTNMLLLIGYYIGANEEAVKQYLPLFKVGLVVVLLAGVGIYFWRHYRRANAAQRQVQALAEKESKKN